GGGVEEVMGKVGLVVPTVMVSVWPLVTAPWLSRFVAFAPAPMPSSVRIDALLPAVLMLVSASLLVRTRLFEALSVAVTPVVLVCALIFCRIVVAESVLRMLIGVPVIWCGPVLP